MRLVRLFAGVFGVLMLVNIGGLQLVRLPSHQLTQWMIFSDKPGSGGSLYLGSADGKKNIRLTQSSVMSDYLTMNATGNQILVAISPSNGYRQGIYQIEPYTQQKQTLLENSDMLALDFNWSLDGKRLAYMGYYIQQTKLHLMHLPSRAIKTLVESKDCSQGQPSDISDMVQPQWSYDGNWVYFEGISCDNSLSLYRIRPDGSEQSLVLSNLKGTFNSCQWTKDGQWILCVGNPDNQQILYRLRPDGSELEALLKDYQGYYYDILTVTTYGWIYLHIDGIFSRIHLDGTGFAIITEDISSPFLVGSQAIYFHKADEIYRLDLATEKITFITNEPYGMYLSGVSPDEQWIYFNELKNSDMFEVLASYQMRLGDSQLIKQNYIRGGSRAWLPGPDYSWHPLYLALGAIGLGLGGFVMRRKV